MFWERLESFVDFDSNQDPLLGEHVHKPFAASSGLVDRFVEENDPVQVFSELLSSVQKLSKIPPSSLIIFQTSRDQAFSNRPCALIGCQDATSGFTQPLCVGHQLTLIRAFFFLFSGDRKGLLGPGSSFALRLTLTYCSSEVHLCSSVENAKMNRSLNAESLILELYFPLNQLHDRG
mmetsp:Transcript_16156/g.66792  ORF Transcript_16156/g.66792 Transcript_16156/m.66792 type:complete len:177 (+) Transcript_16156:1765-2295(+)